MDKQKALSDFLARCFAARVPVYKVCQKAGVAQSTTSRWKKNPESMTGSALGKLEAALDALEAPCSLCGLRVTKPCDQFGCPKVAA